MISFLSAANRDSVRGVALLRLDFNTEDDWRMKAVIPTIRFLLRSASKIVIISHRGRPQPFFIRANKKGAGFDKSLSLKRDASRLQKLLKRRVIFLPNSDIGEVKSVIINSPRGSIFVLENLRFFKGEEENDTKFARSLASLADFYVNDAFAVTHRKDTSVVAIANFLPSYGGLGLEREMESLSRVMENPEHPLIFLLGGGKARDKLGILKYFKGVADGFLVGGAAANTILFLKGVDVGKSLIDSDSADLKKLRDVIGYTNIVLPSDFKSEGGAILDIGRRAVADFSRIIAGAKTIIWSGPMGMIEKKPCDEGSLKIARAIIGNKTAFSIAGGGETVMFLKKHKLDKKFSFISTGGGAMLEFLAGKKLPGIAALEKNFK